MEKWESWMQHIEKARETVFRRIKNEEYEYQVLKERGEEKTNMKWYE